MYRTRWVKLAIVNRQESQLTCGNLRNLNTVQMCKGERSKFIKVDYCQESEKIKINFFKFFSRISNETNFISIFDTYLNFLTYQEWKMSMLNNKG